MIPTLYFLHQSMRLAGTKIHRWGWGTDCTLYSCTPDRFFKFRVSSACKKLNTSLKIIKIKTSVREFNLIQVQLKVSGCYSVTFLNRTPICDWCVVRWRLKNKTHADTYLEQIRLCLQTFLTTLNTIGRTYVFSWGINKHALMITITKWGEIRYSMRFLLMFANVHHRFANATYVLLGKSNREKLKNMKNEPNNTHIP